MARHSVYLGLLDIDINGRLDLKTKSGEASADDVHLYMFSYALIADEVCMQGSAPLKSKSVFIAFSKLVEAFQRNEMHEDRPIFSFVLSDQSESYLSYFSERVPFLKKMGGQNTELSAYVNNEGRVAAQILDTRLNLTNVKRRTNSVSEEYKSSLLFALRSGRVNEHGILDAVAKQAIEILSNEQIIQTHHLLESLGLADREQINAVYRLARERYRRANAFGSESINSETKTHFKWKNISNYLLNTGVASFLSKRSTLTPAMLFKLRNLKSLKAMNELYFECQDQSDVDAFFNVLRELRADGKLRSLMKQSPGAAVAFFFEALNQSEIGYKAVNKGLEQLAKIFLLDIADEMFAKKVHLIYSSAELLEQDLAKLSG